MLERETELIKQLIIESTIGSRSAIRLNDIVAANLPRGAKSFMVADVMRLLEEDFKHSDRLSQISKGIGATVTTERSLLRALAMEYVLQRDELVKLAEDAVHFLENYLCRPQWTLCQLVFEKHATVSFDVLARKLEYVVDYAYFGTVAERYVRRNGTSEIGTGQFKALIARIDQEVVKRHSARELALMTKPIFDFLLFGDASPTRPIPLPALLLFFEDKNITGVKEYLERICQVRSRNQVSMNELIGILEDLYHVETTVKEEVEESEQEILRPIGQAMKPPEPGETHDQIRDEVVEDASAAQSTDETTSTEEAASSVEPVAVEETVPAEETTLAEEAAPPEQDVETAPERNSTEPVEESVEEPRIEVTSIPISELEDDVPGTPTPTPPAISADELVGFAAEREARRFASFLTFPERTAAKEEVPETTALPDINTILTPGQRDAFIRKIFKGDSNASFIFFSSLNTAKTWREAQPYLRDLFRMNGLDFRAPEVVEFTDAMQSRFQPELRKSK